MAKRKHISKARLTEIEELCRQAETFSINDMTPEERHQFHQELDCLIDGERLAPSVVSGAKILRCHLKQHLHELDEI